MSEPIRSTLLLKQTGVEHFFNGANMPPPEGIAKAHQVHGSDLVSSTHTQGEFVPKADGVYTFDRGQWVGVQTADCLPVLYYSTTKPAVAAVHAGWRGLNAGILVKQVEFFNNSGIRPQDLIAVIGPSIGPCCFEVSNETLQAILDKWEWMWAGNKRPWYQGRDQIISAHEWALPSVTYAPTGSNNLWIDLKSIARWQLINAGLKESHIDDVQICTYCGTLTLAGEKFKAETNDFASHRRSTHAGQKAGRQWSVIRLS